MSIHETVAKLSDSTRQALGRLYDRLQAGELDADQFRAAAVARLAQDQVRASSVAVLALSAALSRAEGQVQASPAPFAPDDPQQAAREALDEQESTQAYQRDPRSAYGIAAAAVVMDAYQHASARAMEETGTQFFRRQPGPDACPICIDMADHVIPADEADRQWHHKGCTCTYTPTDDEGNDL